MKEEDILLPEMPENWDLGSYPLWSAITKWGSKVRINALAHDEALEVDRVVESLMTNYAYETVRKNRDAWQKASEEYKAKVAELNHEDSKRPFNLEAAKRGEPLVTRDGYSMKFVAHIPTAVYPNSRIVVLSENGLIYTQTEQGQVYPNEDHPRDLFMAPKPEEKVWVNVDHDGRDYYATVHTSESRAKGEGRLKARIVATAQPITINKEIK